ncbi:MAG TPA: hypothetical protein VFD66_05290, partial [Verrucomicrobiae bacterium]|nr:hypothetical protein [Verrucomicrobiae bacterium]
NHFPLSHPMGEGRGEGLFYPFNFTNNPGVSFTVVASTNLSLQMSSWTLLASVTEVLPGQIQFTDPQATNTPFRFYRVSSH